MKNRAIVSERGTITIPEPIRRRVGIHPGDLIEFLPKKGLIILKHMIVTHLDEEPFLSSGEWDKFDKMVQKQLKKGEYTQYSNLDKASRHSRKLMRRK